MSSQSSTNKPSGRAEPRDGYLTPEPTLGPDAARNQADKIRQATVAGGISTKNSQVAVAESNAKHQNKGKGKSVRLLLPQADKLETNGAEGAEKEKENETKKKGRGKSVLPLRGIDEETDGKVENTNQGALVNTESTKKTTDDGATKDNSNGRLKTKKSQTRAQKKKKGDEEVMRILNTDPKLHFKVLGLNNIHDMPKVPSAYRKLALIVYPDKNNHPRAEEAFISK